MARRSARLQKQPTPTPEPAADDNDSWITAKSSPGVQLPALPEMPELPDPSAKTPQKRQPASRLPHATTATPNRTPIKPAGPEMHPAHHHASTAKPLDEARWLGFQALQVGAQTAPPKASAVIQGTPTKTPGHVARAAQMESSPDFRFRFKSPFAGFPKTFKKDEQGLSPSTKKLLMGVKAGDAPISSRPLFSANEFSSKADVSPERKKAEPKGKMARFSDVHMQQFKKMDSIANHASAFRAARFKPVITQPLKKSPSKPELAKPETSQLKRTQSKMDMTGSGLPRSQSTVRLVPPTRDGPTTAGGPSAKRVKRTETDDAATTRPAREDIQAAPTPDAGTTRPGRVDIQAAPTPARKITSQTALPRLASRLMTPTRASMARSQSVKTTKSASMLPKLTAMRDNARQSMRKASENLERVRSILRTPSRKFSNDPAQVAAGTHMSPPVSTFQKALPAIPATAPVKKHVNFSNSTLQRDSSDDAGKSPSPMKLRAGSEVPSGAVFYPSLPGFNMPEPQDIAESPSASPVRRLTFGGDAPNHPRSFSFESGKPVNFGPSTTGTIRMVRKSDAATLVEGTKRKLDTVCESSDKENSEPAEEDLRSAKKMRPTPATPAKTPAAASKLPRRTPGSTISKSRLAFLATPKRGGRR